MLTAITILFFMQIVGELIARVTGLPLPGPLIGMLLLLLALIVHGRVPIGMRDTCHHSLKHLMLLFIPLVAGIMMYFDRLAHEWIPFLVACMGGVALTMVITAVTFRWVLNRSRAH
ncbi:CidA/LrgA family protein [Candidimonas sp. SYP-B2681]|uniref:CidA/LrgA family protein n=1 Tax=Candidimonas sp. SYP-B2681 TaxID=2497686 RepID=UPI000F88BBDA|nr:CidA/LrgA family protein [Candidimonas sp. SYP-B2681]RTZ48279.1 CidA/LrgA family protein [Candidimonas sp. SYP-B2681]